MDRSGPAGSPLNDEPTPPTAATRDSSPRRTGSGPAGPGGGGARSGGGRPAAANAARERSRVQTLRHAFLELQRTLPSVPPDTKLSKLDVLLLATTYIAHLTRSLQDDAEAPVDPGLGALRGDGYLHPVKKWPMRSRLYIGATGQFLKHSVSGEKTNHDSFPTDSQP
ncbi:transcription factor 24 [Camelus dromedarius]|uniref:Transcription factor 24 n=2 Tax=Camelus TaxID=9836 RepID=A0A8B8S895_CAMFR|nr:transcription factor 24 [Camelus dromedarius]XP_032325934.1 transcription factor 24 [Camelus ferus]